jgi:uncharacterized protein YqgC (DUF456 family)
MDIVWTILAGVLMLAGLVGIFIPFFPDLLLIWAAALGYGLLVGWGEWGLWLFGLITLLAVLGILAEAYVGGAGARMAGASYKAIIAGLILGTIGFFFFPPFGPVIGLLAGTFFVEYLRLRDWRQAGRATLGMGLGYGASFGVKLAFGGLMIGAWLVWVLVS